MLNLFSYKKNIRLLKRGGLFLRIYILMVKEQVHKIGL